MREKIEKLTNEQEKELEVWREKSLQNGYSTTPIDRQKVKYCIDNFYALIGKRPPKIIYCQSPLGMILFSSLRANLGANFWINLRDNLQDNLVANLRANLGVNLHDNLRANLHDNLQDNLRGNLRANLGVNLRDIWHWGGYEIGWITYYLFCDYIGIKYDKKDLELLKLHKQYAESALYLLSYENISFVCERPIKIFLKKVSNKINVLHKDGDMAVEFRDGWGIYVLNGVRVNKEIAVTPHYQLNPELLLTEKNAEVRKEIIRKIGAERLYQKLNGKVIDEWINEKLRLPYKLIKIEIVNRKPYMILYMKNPSVEGVFHAEFVPPEIKTCQEALAFQDRDNGGYESPTSLT